MKQRFPQSSIANRKKKARFRIRTLNQYFRVGSENHVENQEFYIAAR